MKRTKNAIRNIIWGLVNKVIVLVFPFIIRTILIKKLGSEYLGLSSLFTSILEVLNLTELGFSSAIVFSMYKPIAENDTKTICALMNLYKKIYRIIGTIILVIGLAITPFLTNLISGTYPDDINIYVLYLIYLFNTSITYFMFAYKSALLTAHQRTDITSNVHTIMYIIKYLLQIIVLVTLKNYYVYVLTITVTSIANNIVVAYITNKKYPQYVCKGDITEEEKTNIKKRVGGLMIQKVCATTRNSLDSIFISAYLGLTVVAMYSNYYSIISAILGISTMLTSAIVAGVGNSIVVDSVEKNYKDMNKFNFMYMWIAGWCTICLACLYQPFMKIWMGEEYMFSYGVVVLFCMYFYALKMGDIRSVYSEAKGLWWESKYRAIAEVIANIALNWILVKFFGVYGIIAGTLISLLIINFGYGSQILFKYYFKEQKVSEYFLTHGKYALVTLIVCIVTYFVCSFISLEGILGLILKGIICVIVPNILYLVIYRKDSEFNDSKEFVFKILKDVKNKVKV